MTTTEAKNKGATHVLLIKNGLSPQMYYRLNPIGTLSYYSSYGMWMGSNLNGEGEKLQALKDQLIKIQDYEANNETTA